MVRVGTEWGDCGAGQLRRMNARRTSMPMRLVVLMAFGALVGAAAPAVQGSAAPAATSPTVGLPLVAGGPAVTQVSATYLHTCARLDDGTAACWGDNWSGQLGDGTTTDRSLPVAVRNAGNTGVLTGVTSISTGGGYGHTCARLDDGTAVCWGDNEYGQLGDGTTTDRALPVTVRNPAGTGVLTGVTSISAGYDGTCARLDAGTAACWGDNGDGQLGDGTRTDRSLPVAVRNAGNTGVLTGVTAISTQDGHTCARLDAGTAACWGWNVSGQLGDGTTTSRSLPVAVRNAGNTGVLTGVTSISAGPVSHTCARLDDGTATCWGDNTYGQLGDGTTTGRSLPVAVRNVGNTGVLTGVTTISAGSGHTCARLDAGTAACWGQNIWGKLGDGTTTGRSLPVAVRNAGNTGVLTGVTAISAGGSFTCARLDAGTAMCWGWNYYGQLGDGTTTDRTLPVLVVGLGDLAVSPSSGRWNGGNTVTITGDGLAGATRVAIGGQDATSFTQVSPTRLSVVVPAPASKVPSAKGGPELDVTVTAGGVTTKVGTYRYRGLAVVSIRGWTSRYTGSTDTGWPRNNVSYQAFLQSNAATSGQPWPNEVFVDFSYAKDGTASQRTFGRAYDSCETLDSIWNDEALLHTELTNYAVGHEGVDVYLVGHSQGGVIALGYPAWLQATGRDMVTAIPGLTLAGVVSLDSPVGGVDLAAWTAAAVKSWRECGDADPGRLRRLPPDGSDDSRSRADVAVGRQGLPA